MMILLMMMVVVGCSDTMMKEVYEDGKSSSSGGSTLSMMKEVYEHGRRSNFSKYARQAENALQYNWFPDPMQFLNTYQSWNGFDGFWQNGVVLETMANVKAYTNSTQYEKIVHKGLRRVDELSNAYEPEPSYDDMAWYGLAYARVFEVFNYSNNKEFLKTSMDIFDWNWKRGWDTNTTKGSCNGGFWFDNSNVFKGTITNVLMIQLGAKLYRLTGNSSFLERANQTYNFIARTGLIDSSTGVVYDSVDLTTCHADVGGTVWTYTQGITLAGLQELNRTHEAKQVADGTLSHFICSDEDDILTEISCENRTGSTCNEDQVLFKGIFVRSLRYLTDTLLENDPDRARYLTFITKQAQTIQDHSSCVGSKCCSLFRNGPGKHGTTVGGGPIYTSNWVSKTYNCSSPIEQTSALDVLAAAATT
jgi:mannan endo-1,6-alpha-mannosidase